MRSILRSMLIRFLRIHAFFGRIHYSVKRLKRGVAVYATRSKCEQKNASPDQVGARNGHRDQIAARKQAFAASKCRKREDFEVISRRRAREAKTEFCITAGQSVVALKSYFLTGNFLRVFDILRQNCPIFVHSCFSRGRIPESRTARHFWRSVHLALWSLLDNVGSRNL